MNKKLLVAVMLLAVGLMAVPAQVLALDGPHAVFTCNACHIPHAAGGDRLWIDVPSGAGNWGGNKIGQLCYSCHDGTNGGSNMGTYIYTGTTAHGPFYNAIPAEPDGDAGNATEGSTQLAASALPYTSATNPLQQGGIQAIQCTSCHFVHANTDTVSPYLRAGGGATYRGDLCERCHKRGEADTSGEVGNANEFTYPSTRVISLHPVQIAITVPTQGADMVAALTASAAGTPNMGNALGGDTNGPWRLGGKPHAGGTTGVMDCNTCHAVHGDETAGTQGQGNYKLAINNYPANYTSSPLCYGCHERPVVTGGVDHPIDANTGAYAVTYPDDGGPNHGSAPSPWPAGSSANAEVVCSSCHDMHGGMPADASTNQGNDQTGRLRRFNEFATNHPTYPGVTNWCYSCHENASPNNHHSHIGNLYTAQGDAMTSLLDCEDCHGYAGGTYAHNQLVTDGAGFFATRNFGNGNHANSPTWCNYCHAVNPTDIEQPVGRAAATTVANMDGGIHSAGATAITPAGHGVDRGEGTHVLGWDGSFTFGPQNTVVSIPMGATDWPAPASNWASGSIDGLADNRSRYAAAGVGAMVCESCHNIIGNIGYLASGGTGNEGWENNLLLMAYEDDGSGNRSGAAGSSQVGSAFCMYCHYTAGSQGTTGPPGTHQITGQVITAAADNERATDTLITGAGSYADASGAPNAGASYPNADAMDCDSCHRVHDSAPGGTASATTVDYATGAGGTISKGVDFILESATGTAGVYSPTLCVNCHNY